MALSHPGLTSTVTWVESSVLFFGSLALALVGLLGLARSIRQRPERDHPPAHPDD
jgi:hypothetical protein